jgi:hypothetical protein
VRWVSDEPQPGWIEVQLTDADGTVWSFFDKPPIVDVHDRIRRDATYPLEVELACEIVSRQRDAKGRELLTISTRHPWGVEAEDGRDQFQVTPDQLITT